MSVTLRLKNIALPFFTVISAILLIVFSGGVKSGVKNGILLCSDSAVPSLFLFTAVSLFAVESGAANVLGRFISPVTERLFRLSGEKATVLMISLVAGYPVGAGLIASLFEKGKLSKKQAERMLSFCVNAGPAFVINAVGVGTLSSTSDGIRLFAAMLCTSLLFAAVSGHLPKRAANPLFDKTAFDAPPFENTPSLSEAFTVSVSKAGGAMLNLCFFVIFFSGAVGGLSGFLPDDLKSATAFLEVTGGIRYFGRSELQKLAFFLGFGGLSVIFQVASASSVFKPRLLSIILSRLLHGTVSSVFIAVSDILFPRYIEASAQPTPSLHEGSANSGMSALSLIFLCTVILCYAEHAFNRKKRA